MMTSLFTLPGKPNACDCLDYPFGVLNIDVLPTSNYSTWILLPHHAKYRKVGKSSEQ